MTEEYSSSDLFAPNTDGDSASAPAVNTSNTELEQPGGDVETDAQGTVENAENADALNAAPPSPEDTTPERTTEQQAAYDDYLQKLAAEEKTPEFFKNALKTYEKRLAELPVWSPLEEYGTPEEIQEKLARTQVAEMRNNPETGYPELSTEKWATQTYEQDPKIAMQLVKDLAFKPSPMNPGWNIAHEVIASTGIDPTKLDKVLEFVHNGYQTKTISSGAYPAPPQAELEAIAPDLRDAYSALSPDERDLYLPYTNDSDIQKAAKERNLRAEKERLESTVSDESEVVRKEYESKWNDLMAKQTFDNEVFVKSNEHDEASGDRVLTAFNESLVKQSGFSPYEATEITNTLLTALDGRGSAAKMTMQALEAQGIKLDPQITSLLSERQMLNRNIAYFEHPKINDAAQRAAAVNRLGEIERKLLLKGNTVIAQIVQARAKLKVAGVEGQNQALAAAAQSNGINGNGHSARIGTSLGIGDVNDIRPSDIFN